MAAELMTSYAEDLSEVKLIPGRKGVHKVFINDELVFDKKEEGRFPEPSEIIEKLLDVMG